YTYDQGTIEIPGSVQLGNYANNQYCQWVSVGTHESVTGFQIDINMDLQSSNGCSWDYVEVTSNGGTNSG
ncbi:hypothetical protein SK128_008887, partial [Halocaridina rubra]